MEWATVCPLSLPDSDALTVPFIWGQATRLDCLPTWMRTDDVAGKLSYWQRKRLAAIEFALVEKYEANALGERDPGWQEGAGPESVQDAAQARMSLVALSCWLTRPSPFSYEIVVHAHKSSTGLWLINQLNQVPRAEAGPGYDDTQLSQTELERSRELFDRIVSLPRPGAIWTSLYTLWRALQVRGQGEFRILTLWIAIEALFGPEDAREIRHRLAERIALFLAPIGDDARSLYRAVKKGYDIRSKIAHGMRTKDELFEAGDDHMHNAQEWLRKSLTKILLNDRLAATFNSKEREDYLDELALG